MTDADLNTLYAEVHQLKCAMLTARQAFDAALQVQEQAQTKYYSAKASWHRRDEVLRVATLMRDRLEAERRREVLP